MNKIKKHKIITDYQEFDGTLNFLELVGVLIALPVLYILTIFIFSL